MLQVIINSFLMKKIPFILLIAFAFSCQNDENSNMIPKHEKDSVMQTPTKKSYLALGDSYTIGESVSEQERWPIILQQELEKLGDSLQTPKIIAKTGWTTGELDEAIDQENITKIYDLVSVLVGVNDQYRGDDKGFTTERYQKEFADLLDRAIGFAGNDTSQVFVVSIPDYSVTPFASSSDTAKISRELAEYNAIGKEISEDKDVRFFDITPISQEAKSDSSLLASDELHPSGKMYKRWVKEVILEGVKKILE